MLLAERTGSDLGSVFGLCLEGDCQLGEALIKEMQSTFQALGNQEGDIGFAIRQKLGVTITAIVQDYQVISSSFSRQVPFTPICCRMAELGKKAQAVTQQMHAIAGTQAPVTTSPDSADPFAGLITFAKIAAVVVLAAYVVPPILRAAGDAVAVNRR
jgi:hypothetical protein